MSFEGYYQKLCKNGHLYTPDVYIDDEFNDVCPECQEPYIWSHLVDQTNDEGNPYPLKVKKRESCKHCGSVLSLTYHIPKIKDSTK